MAESNAWSPQRLNDAIQRGTIYPLYFLHGDETFLISETLQTLEQTTIGDGMRDFNLNTFYGGDAEASQIRDAVETLPMMSPVSSRRRKRCPGVERKRVGSLDGSYR